MYKLIGHNIKNARQRAGLSQLELAHLVGYESATAISLIENGKRKISIKTLFEIAVKIKTHPYILLKNN